MWDTLCDHFSLNKETNAKIRTYISQHRYFSRESDWWFEPNRPIGGSEVGQPLSIHMFCVVYQCLSWFLPHICWWYPPMAWGGSEKKTPVFPMFFPRRSMCYTLDSDAMQLLSWNLGVGWISLGANNYPVVNGGSELRSYGYSYSLLNLLNGERFGATKSFPTTH